MATSKTLTKAGELTIVYRGLRELKLDPGNPRLHSKKQVEQIARSIETFGFLVPVLTNRSGQVAAGHGRVAAAKLLKLERIPTIRLEHLSEAQLRAFMVADNRLTEIGAWDERLLAEQLKALADAELDFNLEVTGFEMAEIDTMIEGLSEVPEREPDPADELFDDGVRVTKRGDLWLLDRHRVLCADALAEASYARLMDGRRANAVFADPPYNDPIDGYVAGFGKVRHREFAMASGEMTEAQFTEFLSKAFANLTQHSLPGSLHFICMDWRHTGELLAASRHRFSEFKALCVWVKDSGGQGSLYRSRHELVFVFKHGKDKHRNNVQLGQYGRYRTNVWEYARVRANLKNSNEEGIANSHPTIKPVAMVADAIMDCTARNDLVLDSFLGSGTTLIAAERTGRVCYGLELDPRYVDTTIRRWQTFTGKAAIHCGSKRSFREVEEARGH